MATTRLGDEEAAQILVKLNAPDSPQSPQVYEQGVSFGQPPAASGYKPPLSRARMVPGMRISADGTDHDLWGSLYQGNSGIIMLPGAWAMGDGLVLETDVPVTRRKRASSVASYAETTERISESLFRMAGSLTASMSGYIADLADLASSWTVSETDGDDICLEDVDADFTSGGLTFAPRSHSFPPKIPQRKVSVRKKED